MSDTYATWNPADKDASVSLSGGDLTAAWSLSSQKAVRATQGKSSGKHYWEITYNGATNIYCGVGTAAAALSAYIGSEAASYGYFEDVPRLYNNGGYTSYGLSLSNGDVLMIALDMDNGKIWFGKNGTWFASGDPEAGTNPAATGLSGAFYPMASGLTGSNLTANFGASAFAYSVPSGFGAGLYIPGPTEVEIPLSAGLALSALVPRPLPIVMGASPGLTVAAYAPLITRHVYPPAASVSLGSHAPTHGISFSVPAAQLMLSALAPGLSFLFAIPAAGLEISAPGPAYLWALPASMLPTAQVIYKCFLTGDAESPPLADLELPMSSFQCTLRDGDPSYIAAVIPNAVDLIDAITARTNGDIVIKKGYRRQDGIEVLEEIARADYESLREDRGSLSESATISGHKTVSSSTVKSRRVAGLSYYSLQADGRRRLRGSVDLFLRCGDTVEYSLGGEEDSFLVGQISYTVGPNQADMEVAEA
jgi:hypothetical protein